MWEFFKNVRKKHAYKYSITVWCLTAARAQEPLKFLQQEVLFKNVGRSVHIMTITRQHCYTALNKQYTPEKPVKEDMPAELLVGICMHFTEQHSPAMRWKWSHSGGEHCITAQATAMPPSHRQVRHGSSGTKYAPTVTKRPRRSLHVSVAPGEKTMQAVKS